MTEPTFDLTPFAGMTLTYHPDFTTATNLPDGGDVCSWCSGFWGAGSHTPIVAWTDPDSSDPMRTEGVMHPRCVEQMRATHTAEQARVYPHTYTFTLSTEQPLTPQQLVDIAWQLEVAVMDDHHGGGGRYALATDPKLDPTLETSEDL
jgi:hypothetical protein